MSAAESRPVVDLSGDGAQRGEAHGEELRSAIAAALDRWREMLGVRSGRATAAHLRDFLAATTHAATVRERSPDLYAEVLGIARGSGQDPDEILAYNFMDEEWRYRAEVLEACSLFGTTTTADDAVLLGQNMDLPLPMGGSQVALRIAASGDDAAQIVFTAAGLIGLLGVNRLGVACCVNTLARLPWSRSGMPVAFVIREVLRRPDAEAAGRYLASIPHASGQHYGIGDPAGVRGFECSAAGVTAGPREPRLTHTNHALWDPAGTAMDELPGERGPSGTRSRFGAIDGAAERITGSADLEQLFTADADLCILPREPKFSQTFCSAVFRLADPPTVRVALGRPDVTPWRSIEWAS